MSANTIALINLLPWREDRQLRRRQRFCVSLLATATMALAMVAGAVMWSTSLVSERIRVNAVLQSEVGALRQRINHQDLVFRGYQRKQADFADTRRLHAARVQQTRLLTGLSGMMSNGLALTGLHYEPSAVQLHGSARSAQQLSQLLQLLRQRPDIVSAELQALSLNQPPDSAGRQDYSYRLRLQLSPSDLDFMAPEGDG